MTHSAYSQKHHKAVKANWDAFQRKEITFEEMCIRNNNIKIEVESVPDIIQKAEKIFGGKAKEISEWGCPTEKDFEKWES